MAAIAIASLILGGCAQSPSVSPVPAASAGGKAITPSCARPVYPQQAKERKIEGTSIIRLLISAEGKVVKTHLAQSSGDASLDQAAVSALSKCTFTPANYQGKPAQAWTAVHYVWKAD
jgi:TonB family protein